MCVCGGEGAWEGAWEGMGELAVGELAVPPQAVKHCRLGRSRVETYLWLTVVLRVLPGPARFLLVRMRALELALPLSSVFLPVPVNVLCVLPP